MPARPEPCSFFEFAEGTARMLNTETEQAAAHRGAVKDYTARF